MASNLPILTIGQYDILLGKNKRSHAHFGNQRFRQLIQKFSKQYKEATLRKQKGQITSTLISILTASGGRFLRYDDQKEGWFEVSETRRYDKVSHALRSAKTTSGRSSTSSVTESLSAVPNLLTLRKSERVHEHKTKTPDETLSRDMDYSPIIVPTPSSTLPGLKEGSTCTFQNVLLNQQRILRNLQQQEENNSLGGGFDFIDENPIDVEEVDDSDDSQEILSHFLCDSEEEDVFHADCGLSTTDDNPIEVEEVDDSDDSQEVFCHFLGDLFQL